ncbi:Uncharacterized protein SCF082_LOCUS4484, partial [Durusdinium trenchii]
MSSLDVALEQQSNAAKTKLKERAGKSRLVADSSTGVRDIQSVLRNFLTYKETSDLHALISPGKFAKLTWKSQPDPEYIVKMANLCYDLAAIAPNSKLAGKKIREALQKLLDLGEVRNTTERENKSFIDNSDLLIRIAMGMFRSLKYDLLKRDQVLRRIGSPDSNKIKLVLERLILPTDYDGGVSDGEEDATAWAAADGGGSRSDLALPLQDAQDFDISEFEKISSNQLQPLPHGRFTGSSASFRMSRLELGPPSPVKRKLNLDEKLLYEAEGHIPKKAVPKSKAGPMKRPAIKRPPSSLPPTNSHEPNEVPGEGAVGHADDGDERGDEPPTKLMFRKNVHSRAYNKEKMHNSREALTSKLRRMLPVPLVLLLCERLRHK